MKNWILLIVLGILAVLTESSLAAWPWVLAVVWLASGIEDRWMIVYVASLGIVLDVLMVRTVGVSSMVLLVFWAVLTVLRSSFRGNSKIELLWLVLAGLIWNLVLGTGNDGVGMIIWAAVVMGAIMLNRRSLNVKEIRLK